MRNRVQRGFGGSHLADDMMQFLIDTPRSPATPDCISNHDSLLDFQKHRLLHVCPAVVDTEISFDLLEFFPLRPLPDRLDSDFAENDPQIDIAIRNTDCSLILGGRSSV
jgi:hypothetical protein